MAPAENPRARRESGRPAAVRRIRVRPLRAVRAAVWSRDQDLGDAAAVELNTPAVKLVRVRSPEGPQRRGDTAPPLGVAIPVLPQHVLAGPRLSRQPPHGGCCRRWRGRPAGRASCVRNWTGHGQSPSRVLSASRRSSHRRHGSSPRLTHPRPRALRAGMRPQRVTRGIRVRCQVGRDVSCPEEAVERCAHWKPAVDLAVIRSQRLIVRIVWHKQAFPSPARHFCVSSGSVNLCSWTSKM
jgi:hypothetical protein